VIAADAMRKNSTTLSFGSIGSWKARYLAGIIWPAPCLWGTGVSDRSEVLCARPLGSRQGDRAELTAGGRPSLSRGETSILIPRLLSKIDEVLRLPHLSDFDTVEVRAIAERIESLFLSIRDTVDDRHYELLTATVDRLHREVALRSRSRSIAQGYRIALKRLHFLQPATRVRETL
jgi:hypothetical protein